jgi:hypothetical protein
LEDAKFYGIETSLPLTKLRLKQFLPSSMWVDEERVVLKSWHGKILS